MRSKVLLVYGIAILVGIATGIVGSCFQIGIHRLSAFISYLVELGQGKIPVLFSSAFISMILALFAWFLVHRYSPEASGSGVPEIEGVLLRKRPIFWRRLLPVKFIGGISALSANLVLGREGPTIQMGGNLGAMFAEYMKLTPNRRDTLIAAGAAAGLATAFNAPFAAVLFVVEEMRNAFNFNFTNFKMVALSSVTATIAMQAILGPGPAISMSIFSAPALSSLYVFFLFGLIVGLAGLFFNKMLIKSLAFSDKLTTKQRFCYVGLVGAAAGGLAVSHPAIVGGGYLIIEETINTSSSLSFLLMLLPLRLAATLFSYSTRVPGGIFAPLLALGTILGLASHQLMAQLVPDLGIHPAMLAVAGMGALFSAAVRAPLTGIVLVVEMTQNYLLILPLMVCCLTSTTVVQLANNAPIYTQLLRRTLKKARLSAHYPVRDDV